VPASTNDYYEYGPGRTGNCWYAHLVGLPRVDAICDTVLGPKFENQLIKTGRPTGMWVRWKP